MTKPSPARSASQRFFVCPKAESAQTTSPGGSSWESRSNAAPMQDSSAAAPASGRTYNGTPWRLVTASAWTCRATRRSAPQPLCTKEEAS
jgi:hypothetical protein